jgi:hypothetical protein
MRHYPDFPGFQDTDTSRAAAREADDFARPLKDRVLKEISSAGPTGLTADEASRRVHNSILSVRPRVAELKKSGVIVDSGRRRANSSGRRAIVWMVTKTDD